MAKGNRVILGSHLIWTGYGHWLANDPRGSGSDSIRKEELKELGEILPGRQYPQPPKGTVKEFYREADGLLEHERVWFDERMRMVLGSTMGEAAAKYEYTIWALAVCSNHAHAVVRAHRDRSEIIWQNLAASSGLALRGESLVPKNHPVWSHRPYKVFLYSPADVLGRIDYVKQNPVKEGLAAQAWEFVKKSPWG